jgi:hypothetical protein
MIFLNFKIKVWIFLIDNTVQRIPGIGENVMVAVESKIVFLERIKFLLDQVVKSLCVSCNCSRMGSLSAELVFGERAFVIRLAFVLPCEKGFKIFQAQL